MPSDLCRACAASCVTPNARPNFRGTGLSLHDSDHLSTSLGCLSSILTTDGLDVRISIYRKLDQAHHETEDTGNEKVFDGGWVFGFPPLRGPGGACLPMRRRASTPV